MACDFTILSCSCKLLLQRLASIYAKFHRIRSESARLCEENEDVCLSIPCVKWVGFAGQISSLVARAYPSIQSTVRQHGAHASKIRLQELPTELGSTERVLAASTVDGKNPSQNASLLLLREAVGVQVLSGTISLLATILSDQGPYFSER